MYNLFLSFLYTNYYEYLMSYIADRNDLRFESSSAEYASRIPAQIEHEMYTI